MQIKHQIPNFYWKFVLGASLGLIGKYVDKNCRQQGILKIVPQIMDTFKIDPFSDNPEIVEAVLSSGEVKNVKDMSGRWYFSIV